MSTPTMVTRSVESNDPSLSAEANAALTRELRAVIGHDAVEMEASRPDHRADRHATHNRYTASAIVLRVFIAIVGFMLAMTALIAGIATTQSWVLVGATTLLFLPTTWVVAQLVLRTFTEFEHMDPDVAAMLSAEGVGDPDRTFTELVRDFRPATGGMSAPSPS